MLEGLASSLSCPAGPGRVDGRAGPRERLRMRYVSGSSSGLGRKYPRSLRMVMVYGINSSS